MHYNISQEITIKSENAAKSYAQPNKYLLNLLKKFDEVKIALDYGCGKARYTLPLCNISKQVDAIDSTIQITRRQIIWGKNTTLLEWSKEIQNLNVFSFENFVWKAEQYDFILNSNVLSAIPNDSDRLTVLQNIKKGLKRNGRALITTQYRNSYFSLYNSKPNALKYNDGWIIKNKECYSFYGLIDKVKMQKYFDIVGVSVAEVLLHDGSVFITIKN